MSTGVSTQQGGRGKSSKGQKVQIKQEPTVQKPHQATTEQLRRAQLTQSLQAELASITEGNVSLVMEITNRDRGACEAALIDCQNDADRAVDVLINENEEDSWQEAGKKKKKQQPLPAPVITEPPVRDNKGRRDRSKSQPQVNGDGDHQARERRGDTRGNRRNQPPRFARQAAGQSRERNEDDFDDGAPRRRNVQNGSSRGRSLGRRGGRGAGGGGRRGEERGRGDGQLESPAIDTWTGAPLSSGVGGISDIGSWGDSPAVPRPTHNLSEDMLEDEWNGDLTKSAVFTSNIQQDIPSYDHNAGGGLHMSVQEILKSATSEQSSYPAVSDTFAPTTLTSVEFSSSTVSSQPFTDQAATNSLIAESIKSAVGIGKQQTSTSGLSSFDSQQAAEDIKNAVGIVTSSSAAPAKPGQPGRSVQPNILAPKQRFQRSRLPPPSKIPAAPVEMPRQYGTPATTHFGLDFGVSVMASASETSSTIPASSGSGLSTSVHPSATSSSPQPSSTDSATARPDTTLEQLSSKSDLHQTSVRASQASPQGTSNGSPAAPQASTSSVSAASSSLSAGPAPGFSQGFGSASPSSSFSASAGYSSTTNKESAAVSVSPSYGAPAAAQSQIPSGPSQAQLQSSSSEGFSSSFASSNVYATQESQSNTQQSSYQTSDYQSRESGPFGSVPKVGYAQYQGQAGPSFQTSSTPQGQYGGSSSLPEDFAKLKVKEEKPSPSPSFESQPTSVSSASLNTKTTTVSSAQAAGSQPGVPASTVPQQQFSSLNNSRFMQNPVTTGGAAAASTGASSANSNALPGAQPKMPPGVAAPQMFPSAPYMSPANLPPWNVPMIPGMPGYDTMDPMRLIQNIQSLGVRDPTVFSNMNVPAQPDTSKMTRAEGVQSPQQSGANNATTAPPQQSTGGASHTAAAAAAQQQHQHQQPLAQQGTQQQQQQQHVPPYMNPYFYNMYPMFPQVYGMPGMTQATSHGTSSSNMGIPRGSAYGTDHYDPQSLGQDFKSTYNNSPQQKPHQQGASATGGGSSTDLSSGGYGKAHQGFEQKPAVTMAYPGNTPPPYSFQGIHTQNQAAAYPPMMQNMMMGMMPHGGHHQFQDTSGSARNNQGGSGSQTKTPTNKGYNNYSWS